MPTITIDDKHLVENWKEMEKLQELGFSEESIQKMYTEQYKADKEAENDNK